MSDKFKIITIFSKPAGKILKDLREKLAFALRDLGSRNEKTYITFERLPVKFDDVLHQYAEPEEFVYTNMIFQKNKFFSGENPKEVEKHFKEIEKDGNGEGNIIYLF